MLRSEGAMRGVVSVEDLSDAELIEIARQSPQMTDLILTKGATTKEPYDIDGTAKNSPHVVVPDFIGGIKHNILS